MIPARALLILLAAVLPACWTAALREIPETRSIYDDLPSSALARLARARGDLESGRVDAALRELEALATEFPENIPVGVWLQEAEIALAARATPTGSEDDPAPISDALRERYRNRVEEERGAVGARSVVSLVLAARVEPDPLAAQVLLDRAEKLDARCAWCSYGRAYLAARAGDWAEVRMRIARAKAANPGHMPTLWLETWMLARSGNLSQAIVSLDTWIAAAQEDPRLDRRLVSQARLDRALLAVLDGDASEAREILEEIRADERIDPARLALIEAGAEEEIGEPEAALAAAQRAEQLRPNDLDAVIQQALLHEMWLGDPYAAEADWTRALALTRSDPTLGSLLERARARVRLERLTAARAEAAARPAEPR
ncbi:MAG: tetratricopeptide repeat protein [Planctomycetota bacterium]